MFDRTNMIHPSPDWLGLICAHFSTVTFSRDMRKLFDAAEAGNLERVMLLVQQGEDKNQIGPGAADYDETALSVAVDKGHFDVVRFLVEQGAEMEKCDRSGNSPIAVASMCGHLEITRNLLEQGADRDKADNNGWTPLHLAAERGHLETAKLLMVYGADLNARNNDGKLPIDVTHNEEVKQAIRDEPRRRIDEAPGKRATEQDRHPNAATLASAQQAEEEDDDEEQQPSNKKPRLDEGTEAEEGKVAEEDEPSEPSDEEDDN